MKSTRVVNGTLSPKTGQLAHEQIAGQILFYSAAVIPAWLAFCVSCIPFSEIERVLRNASLPVEYIAGWLPLRRDEALFLSFTSSATSELLSFLKPLQDIK